MSPELSVPATLSGTFELAGNTTVNRLGFGAMRITGPGIWGEPRDVDEARRVLRRTVELGVNFIDTAHAYGPEVSERLIGETLYPYPDDLVIATKSGLQRTGANREAKLLQLTHAFETLGANRVEFKTHARNERSRNALAGIGATFEGVFRNHTIMPDGSLRDSAYFSVIAGEWPVVKAALAARLDR